MARIRAHVVSHTHWDRAWYLPFQRYRVHLVELVDGLLELLEGDPEFQAFTLDGQTALLDDYLAVRPENRERMAALVAAGRLEIGPWFVLPDAFLPSGEALIRNLQRGMRTARGLGAEPRDGYMPDSFGHIEQMPQLLRGFGLRSFLFMRGLGEADWERLGCEFSWRAPDGSEVLAVYLREGYLDSSALGYPQAFGDFEGLAPSLELARERIETSLATRAARSPSGAILCLNGCDHMPVQPEAPRLLAKLDEQMPDVEFVHGTVRGYVDEVLAARGVTREVFEGDLLGNAHHPVLSNVWSTRIGLKQANWRAQWWLEQIAEPLCVAAGVRGAALVALLDEAWRLLLLNHAHDDICGCSVDAVHEDDVVRFREVEEIAAEVTSECLRAIARRVGLVHAGRSQWLAVFEPNAGAAARTVEAVVFFPRVEDEEPPHGLSLLDPAGRAVEVQVLERDPDAFRALRCDTGFGTRFRIAFQAPAVEHASFGFWRVDPGDANAAPHSTAALLENATWRVRAGLLGVELEHRPTGVVLEDALWFESLTDLGDEYTFGAVTDDIVRTTREIEADAVLRTAAGPVFDEVEVRWTLRRPRAAGDDVEIALPVALRLRLPRGDGELELRPRVDNTVEDHRLRLVVTHPSRGDRADAGGAFTVTRRDRVADGTPESAPGYPGERIYPTQFCRDFVRVVGTAADLTLALRGLHEFELVEGGVAVTLLRAVGTLSRKTAWRKCQAGPSLPTPGAQCSGQHEFELQLMLAAAGTAVEPVAARALEFARPAFAMQARVAPFGQPGRDSGDTGVLVAIDGDDVGLSACRLVDEGHVVVRVWNRAEAPRQASIALGDAVSSAGMRVVAAARADLDEQPRETIESSGSGVTIALGPRRIETILFTIERT